jgi:hypothetical protein
MRKVAVVLFTLLFLGLFFAACQKMKEPEQKKGVEAQRKELKQESSGAQVKGGEHPPVSKPEARGGQERSDTKVETSQAPSETERKSAFKEPVLLWEREFEPPLIDISDQNSSKEYIAIQGGGKEGRPTKILFLDSKGRTIREIPLGKKEKRKIPPEQVWLTHYGERWRDEKSKKSFRVGKEIETVTDKAFVSGNGEYFAIVTQDTAFESAGKEADTYYSSWYEFAYYDKTGKFLWKVVPKDNYGFDKAYVSYDGSRILIVDEAILDYFGQRYYLYDEKGNLLKDEDHLVSAMVGQAARDKEAREWLKQVEISRDGKYIAYIKGKHNDSKVGLMDSMGKMLWEKRFDKTHWRLRLIDTGKSTVASEKTIYFVNINGDILSKIDDGIVPIPPVSQSGNKLITEGELGNPGTIGHISIYDSPSGNVVLKFKIGDVLSNPGITWVNQVDFFEKDRFMLISYNIRKKTDSICIYSMEENRVIWKKEDLGEKLLFRLSPNAKHLSLLDSPSYPQIKKVIIFEAFGGKDL